MILGSSAIVVFVGLRGVRPAQERVDHGHRVHRRWPRHAGRRAHGQTGGIDERNRAVCTIAYHDRHAIG